MSDYFSQVEMQLERAARERRHLPLGARPRGRALRPLLALVAALLMAASALAASGVLPLGSPVELPARPNAKVGSGVPAPGGSRLLAVSVPDPEGGPPWGLRVVRTTRGLVCLQVGRLQGGRLGVLGIDGAFHDDGRFHPLPTDDLPNSLPGLAVGFSEVGENSTCHLPGEAFSGDRIGVERSAAGPADTTHEPRRQLRDMYFGSLGPQALSVSSLVGARQLRQSVVPGLGAYLLVLPTGAREQLATGGGAMGTPGGLSPMKPLTAIVYRIHGHVCERRIHGPTTLACPPPQSLYPHRRRVTARSLHRKLSVVLRTLKRYVVYAKVSFLAPFAVTGAGQSYQLRIPIGRCHSSGAGGYAGMSTNRDFAAGARVSQTIDYPFDNTCGARRVTIEALFAANGQPPVSVGRITVDQPPGTRANPLSLRPPELRFRAKS